MHWSFQYKTQCVESGSHINKENTRNEIATVLSHLSSFAKKSYQCCVGTDIDIAFKT